MYEEHPRIQGLLEFVRRHSLLVIILFAAITAGFGVATLDIRVDPDLESLLSDDEESTRLMRKYRGGETEHNYFVFAAEAADPFTLEGLAALSRAIGEIEALPEIEPGITPFSLFTFSNEAGRFGLRLMSRDGEAPRTEEELAAFRARLTGTPFAENLVVSPDATTLVSFFQVQNTDNYSRLMDRIDGILGALRPHYRTYTTGTIPFMDATETYLSRDLSRLLLFAALVILVSFYLGFRAARAVLLPLLIVLMGTVWCLGFMALVGFPLSMFGVVIPPLVLALGSSYSIHILNQYYREGSESEPDRRWISGAIAHVNRTILLASATTIAGLLSLLVVDMRQTREFAVSTSVGIAACALLSLFFFPAMLYRMKPPRAGQSQRVAAGPLTGAISRLGSAAVRGRYAVAAVLAVLVVLFAFSITRIRYNTDAMSYYPRNAGVVQDMRFFAEKIGGFEEVSISLSAPGGQKGYFLSLAALREVAAFEEALAAIPDVSYISSFVQYLKYLNQVMYGEHALPTSRAPVLLLSRYVRVLAAETEGELLGVMANEDFSVLTISLRIYDSARGAFVDEVGLRRILARIDEIQAERIPPEIVVERWGPILRYLSLSNVLQRDSIKSLLIAVAAVLVITAAAFRSIPYGLYALIPLLTGVMLNVVFMVVARIPLDMITIMVSSVAVGVGVDDSIHFLIQFRRQRAETPGDLFGAIAGTMSVTGRPIVLTSVSIVAGLLILGLATFRPIMYFGLLVCFTLAATCLGTIVVLPAVLALGAKRKAGARLG
ncbi:MAG: MMPL family transporter [Spirochaetales bacterium]|nr:MMPL family transporter [Spirochaetales bacterium]